MFQSHILYIILLLLIALALIVIPFFLIKRIIKLGTKNKYLIIGVLITPITLFLAFLSAGYGEGNYFFTKLFFPISMLSTLITGNTITIPAVVFSFFQFPICGFIFDRLKNLKILFWTVVSVFLLHLLLYGLSEILLHNFTR
jgi:hypothetical protein